MNSLEKNQLIYTNAVNTYGDDTRSCNWADVQRERYYELYKMADLQNASVLDVGCGIGGFYEYVTKDQGVVLNEYLGIDIVGEMIELAKEKYQNSEVTFRHMNLMTESLGKSKFDYGFLCGVFNFLDEKDANTYIKNLIAETWKYCKKGMAFNFISSYVNFKEEELSYHCPVDILQFVIENMSRKVELHHHYFKCDTAIYVYKE